MGWGWPTNGKSSLEKSENPCGGGGSDGGPISCESDLCESGCLGPFRVNPSLWIRVFDSLIKSYCFVLMFFLINDDSEAVWLRFQILGF